MTTVLLMLGNVATVAADPADDAVERTVAASGEAIRIGQQALEDGGDYTEPVVEGLGYVQGGVEDTVALAQDLKDGGDPVENVTEFVGNQSVPEVSTEFINDIIRNSTDAVNDRIQQTVPEVNQFIRDSVNHTNSVVRETFNSTNGLVRAGTKAVNHGIQNSTGIANEWIKTGTGIANNGIRETTGAANNFTRNLTSSINKAVAEGVNTTNRMASGFFGSLNEAISTNVAAANNGIRTVVSGINKAIYQNSPNNYLGQGANGAQDLIHGYEGDATGIGREVAEAFVGTAQGDSSVIDETLEGDTSWFTPEQNNAEATGTTSGPPLQPRFFTGASCPPGHYRWQAADADGRKGRGCAAFQASTAVTTPILLDGRTFPDGEIVVTQPNNQGHVTLEVTRQHQLHALRIEVQGQGFEYQYIDQNGNRANQPRTVTATLDGIKSGNSVLLFGNVNIDTDISVDWRTSGTSASTLRLFAIDDTSTGSFPKFHAVELGRLQSFDRSIAQALPSVIEIDTTFDGGGGRGGLEVTAESMGGGIPILFRPEGPSQSFVLDRAFTGLEVSLDYESAAGSLHISNGRIDSPSPIDALHLPVGDRILKVHGLKLVTGLDVVYNKGTHQVGDCDTATLTSGQQFCIFGNVQWPGLQISMTDPDLDIWDIPQGELEIVMGSGPYARIDTSALAGTSDLGATIEVENQFGLDRLVLEQVADVELTWGEDLDDVSIDATFATAIGSRVEIQSDGLTLKATNVERIRKGVPELISSDEIIFDWPATTHTRTLELEGQVGGNSVELSAGNAEKLGLFPGGDGYLLMISNLRLDRPDGWLRANGEGEIKGYNAELDLDIDRVGWRDNYHIRFDVDIDGPLGARPDYDEPNPGNAASYEKFGKKVMKVKTLHD